MTTLFNGFDEFADGDEIDSAAIEEDDDAYAPPADPDAEPAELDDEDGHL